MNINIIRYSVWLWFALGFLIILSEFNHKCEAAFMQQITLRSINYLNTLNESVWQNFGFENVNTTPAFGNSRVPEYTTLLRANKPAKLITFLNDFNNNVLCINFSSSIISIPKPTAIPSVELKVEPNVVLATPISVSLSDSSNKNLTNHNSIIQIFLDPSNPNVRTEIHKVVKRKRRELDNSEILQIHQIINMANANKEKQLLLPPVPIIIPQNLDINTATIPKISEITNISSIYKPSSEFTQNSDITRTSNIEANSAIAYENWKTSTISKSIRPPGLYLLINEEVIFDNWVGVWNNLHNVIGKWSSNPQAQISNRTNILYTWERPVSNYQVKVSFEWDPPDSSTYLFLDDISISTFEGGNGGAIEPNILKSTTTESTTIITNRQPSGISDESNGNKNITILIVVKSESVATVSSSRSTPTQTPPNDSNLNLTRNSSLNLQTSTEMTPIITQTTTTMNRNVTSKIKDKKNLTTSIIILAVLGCSSFVFLIFMLWIRMSGGHRRKCGRVTC